MILQKAKRIRMFAIFGLNGVGTILHVIEDYAATVGEMPKFATQVNQKQPGNPVKPGMLRD